MQIDPRMVAWEDQKPAIDTRMVSWDGEKEKLGTLNQMGRDLVGGAIRGAGSIGATIIRPFETAEDNRKRRKAIDEGLTSLIGSDPQSLTYGLGKTGAEIAGTLGVGGVLAKPLSVALPSVAQAIATGGMTAGGAGMGVRALGGAVAGGAAAGLVNPDDALTGAAIGAAMPGAVKLVGLA